MKERSPVKKNILKLIPFIEIIAGKEYLGATGSLHILSIALAISLIGGLIGNVLLLPAIPEGNWLWWLLSLPVMVLELCAAYQEFYAHAEVLEELDPELAGKWRLLWKWWIGLLLGLFGCIFLALISAILGLLAMLADAIGLLVVGIVKLVYLYRTAKRFREYQPAALQKEVL